MIIYDKIKNIYTKNEIEKMFPRISARKIIFERGIVRMDVIAKGVSFESIDYTLQDYIRDYNKDKIYKELWMVFEIYKQGFKIEEFMREYSLPAHFRNIIRYGLDYNTTMKNGYKLINLFKIRVDASKFEVDKSYETHIELFGIKEELEAFKTEFKIEHSVLFEPLKKSWHLAFDGMLAEYIRREGK